MRRSPTLVSLCEYAITIAITIFQNDLRNNKKAWRYRCKWGLNVESLFVNFSSTIVTFHDVTFLDVTFVRGYFLYKKSGVVNWYLYQCQKTAVEPPTLGLFSKFPGFVLQYISKWLFGLL